jgi:hypothetical protein
MGNDSTPPDVHAAIYQHLIDCIGCPSECLEDYGLVISRIEIGSIGEVLETVLVVSDGQIRNEYHQIFNNKHHIQIFEYVNLSDPNSLDFQSIRKLAGMCPLGPSRGRHPILRVN